MKKPFSQVRAMLAITRASLKAIFRSPSAVVFSFVFPLVFILVFGFLGGGSRISVRVAFDPGCDTTSKFYYAVKSWQGITVINKSLEETREDLEKGRITAIIDIQKNTGAASPANLVTLKTSEAVSQQNLQVLRSLLESVIKTLDRQENLEQPTVASINSEVIKIPGRIYRTIDFILPGQLGFSLLSAGVFGVAFIFFNLRQTLVLKRFFATPINRTYIVFGEGIARVLFGMITAIVILLIGHFAFDFTLVHGILTFIELLILSLIGLIVFMGFGFVVSGLAKNESVIPPFANLITLPQFLLGGTFFTTDAFPSWLKTIADILPLKHLNDAMRNVAFEGAHLSDCLKQIGIMGLWGIAIYALAIKVFRWE
ncbi:MAG: ABC transporter permease [Terrimonas sp.]|nr:ABC transporter permease [Terrimonas sp.]